MKNLFRFFLMVMFAVPVFGEINCPEILVGSTDVSVYLRIIDSTDGTPEQAVNAASNPVFWYAHGEHEAHIDITDSNLSAETDAHTDNAFIHVDDGYYRLDLPDDCCDAGAEQLKYGGEVSNMIVIGGTCALVAYDPYDAGLGADLEVSVYEAKIFSVVTATTNEWGAVWYTNGAVETAATDVRIHVYTMAGSPSNLEGADGENNGTALAEAGSTDQWFLSSSNLMVEGTLYGIRLEADIDGSARTDKFFASRVGANVIISQFP